MNGDLKFEGIYLYSFFVNGKEYNENILEYEGDFLYKRKWNGNGYDKNGKITHALNNGNGKIKNYRDGNLIFEGEVLNGKPNGKGKEYNRYNQLIFYCVFLDGQYWNGIGRAKNDNNDGDSEDDELSFFEYINGKKYPIKI